MPELPEVKNLVDDLNQLLSGHEILNITLISNKSIQPKINKLKFPLKILAVKQKGKMIYFDLGNVYIFSHLGLTGFWSLEPDQHTRVHIIYNGSEDNKPRDIYYSDVRGFGKFDIIDQEELNGKLNKLGPDVLSSAFTFDNFKVAMAKHPNKDIASVLINQDIIAGIGNLYRADILYQARIHPLKKVKDIGNLKTLYDAIKDIINKGYSEGGTQVEDYKNLYNSSGYYEPLVYRKEKDSAGNHISVIKLVGRSVYYVPKLQKFD